MKLLAKPKPLILLNNKPILSYIISHYRKYNVNQFLIAGGYKYKKIIKYFCMLKDKNIFFDKDTSIKINQKNISKILKIQKKKNIF